MVTADETRTPSKAEHLQLRGLRRSLTICLECRNLVMAVSLHRHREHHRERFRPQAQDRELVFHQRGGCPHPLREVASHPIHPQCPPAQNSRSIAVPRRLPISRLLTTWLTLVHQKHFLGRQASRRKIITTNASEWRQRSPLGHDKLLHRPHIRLSLLSRKRLPHWHLLNLTLYGLSTYALLPPQSKRPESSWSTKDLMLDSI